MRVIFLVLMSLFFATSAVAQELPMVQMLSEDDTEIHRRCGINHGGLEAAVTGALRRNGYRISQRIDDLFAMVGYVSVSAVATQSLCAVTLEVEFSFDDVSLAPWGQRYYLKHVICSRIYTITGAPHTLQARLRNNAIELTEICISEEHRKRRG